MNSKKSDEEFTEEELIILKVRTIKMNLKFLEGFALALPDHQRKGLQAIEMACRRAVNQLVAIVLPAEQEEGDDDQS